MPQPTSVGLLLKRYRGRRGLTQEELAGRAGLSVTGISRIERGLRPTPHCATIHLLADALDLSPDDRVALEQAACRPASGRPALAHDERLGRHTVSLGTVLQAIVSLADAPPA